MPLRVPPAAGAVFCSSLISSSVGAAVFHAILNSGVCKRVTGTCHVDKVREVLLWGSDEPDLFLDATDTFDKKREALYRHVSQVGEPTEARETRARERYAEAGKTIGVAFAEQFKRIEIWR